MFDVTQYFKEDNSLYPKSGLKFWVFDSTKANSFVQDCLVPFREAYIEEKKLRHIIRKYKTKREDEITERLPTKSDVKAGDFGEILALYLACQIWSPTVNVIPKKWRLKDNKKASSNYTDIILFKLGDADNPSTTDAMFTYEVKTRAGKLKNIEYYTHKRKSCITYKDGKKESTILEAVFDAGTKDAVERAAETIPYLLTRCKDEDLDDLYKQIYRFGNAVKMTYQKEHNAVAVIDIVNIAEQMGRMPMDLLVSHPLVKNVYCVPMENLGAIYKRVYREMPQKA